MGVAQPCSYLSTCFAGQVVSGQTIALHRLHATILAALYMQCPWHPSAVPLPNLTQNLTALSALASMHCRLPAAFTPSSRRAAASTAALPLCGALGWQDGHPQQSSLRSGCA